MRVVHYLQGRANPNGTNGGDRVIHNLATCMAELDAQVFVFGLSDKAPLASGRAIVQNFRPPRDPLSLPSILKSRLGEIKPDVVHFHGVWTPRTARLAQWLRRRDIPYAISPHGGLMEGVLLRGRMKKAAYLALLGRTFCSGASLIHCVSEAEVNAVRPFSGSVPTVVAPHGLQGTNPASVDRGAIHREYPKLKGKRIFGFLGRLDPAQKGLDLLVEACARIRPSLSNAVVLIAGPDWKDRMLAVRGKVTELGLQDTVLFVGPKMGQDKFNFLASCDVFVHPSRWEAGVPFSVLDALELARPCLVSTGRFFGDFFQRHDAGIQVLPTTAGVEEGLRYFADASTDKLDVMGATGREAVLREFSWERSAQKLLDAYARQHRWKSQEEKRCDAPAVA
jgi:glycosyltransferase involved in cell wall biosynthesis